MFFSNDSMRQIPCEIPSDSDNNGNLKIQKYRYDKNAPILPKHRRRSGSVHIHTFNPPQFVSIYKQLDKKENRALIILFYLTLPFGIWDNVYKKC